VDVVVVVVDMLASAEGAVLVVVVVVVSVFFSSAGQPARVATASATTAVRAIRCFISFLLVWV
jgi:hypothetical protein